MAIRLLFFWLAVGTATAQQLDVMTYNIRFDNPRDGINQWSSRKNKVFKLIKKYNPDIFGVQEALHHQLTDIQKNCEGYKFIGVGRDDGKEKGEYSAIFYKTSRFDVIEQSTFWLSETPQVPGSKSWDAAITRVATWAKFLDKKTNKQFLLINTHFDHIGKEARKQSAAMLKSKAAELGANFPTIITGDFNITRDEEPYAVMMQPSTMELFDSAPKNSAGTFCNFGVNSQECRAIDYIFYSKEWLVSKYEVIQDHDGKNYPSDHLPVQVSFIAR